MDDNAVFMLSAIQDEIAQVQYEEISPSQSSLQDHISLMQPCTGRYDQIICHYIYTFARQQYLAEL